LQADWACGGSFYAQMAYERQLKLKAEVVEDAFARIAKMALAAAVPMLGSTERGYRMRARLHVKDGRFGFFREGTHDLCDPAPTHQLLPETLDALRRVHTILETARLTSCEVSENVDATERAVLLELAPSATAPHQVDPIDGVSGLVFIDHEQGHVAVSYGSPYVTDRIGASDTQVALTHHVQSFFQGNRYLLSELVARVVSYVPPGAVTDLYAGVGLFAVSLARRGDTSVVAVEGDRSSARDLESNAAPFGTAVHVQHLSVESYLQRRGLQRPDTVLLDPPRTGISQEAMSAVLGLKVPRIVYLSCDPATLARDVRRFIEAGYGLDHIEAFDLFPNTAHIETLVVLTRPT
jgi:23S rRNA (uracil1939-C5)-methyltransferase